MNITKLRSFATYFVTLFLGFVIEFRQKKFHYKNGIRFDEFL